MFNYVDFLILVLIIFLVWQGYRVGMVAGLLNLLVTLASFVVALNVYPYISDFFVNAFRTEENIARVIAFIVALVVVELVLNTTATYFYGKVAPHYRRSSMVAKVDHYTGVLPSLVVGLFLLMVMMLLIMTLPVKDWLREPIQESWWGRNVVPKTLVFAPQVEQTLNRLPYKSLVYIITPQSPTSDKSQNLNIPSNITITADPTAEQEMWKLINKERKAEGLNEVKFDDTLRDVGRSHCSDMFERNYFSHYTPEGKSPFDRLDEAGVRYISAGENLAYAPNVTLAHQGLMNSPGHKANILRKSFGTVGVGVIDGGFYGKMFCQEFTN